MRESLVVASNGLKVEVETGSRKKVKFFKINIHYGTCAKCMFFMKVWCSFNVS